MDPPSTPPPASAPSAGYAADTLASALTPTPASPQTTSTTEAASPAAQLAQAAQPAQPGRTGGRGRPRKSYGAVAGTAVAAAGLEERKAAAARRREQQAERRRQLTTRHCEPGDRVCHWVHCGKVLPSLEALVDHLADEHVTAGRGAPHVCEWVGCARYGETQISRFAVLQHLRRHTNERPFQCIHEGCGVRFSRIDNLSAHLKAHLEGKTVPREEAAAGTGGDGGGSGDGSGKDDRGSGRYVVLPTPPRTRTPKTDNASKKRRERGDEAGAAKKRRREGTTGAPAARRHMAVSTGLHWYRRHCRILTACLRHEVWENAGLAADLEDAEATVAQLKREQRVLERELRVLQLLQARQQIDQALATAGPASS